MDMPFVSIILPAYNAEKFIRKSLESALAQTYRNLEILVVDDGSFDKTADIIESYNDQRIRYFFQKNQGQGPARNYAFRESRGRYITFLDADDYYLPDKIEKQVRYLAEHPECRVVYCNALHYDTSRSKELSWNWRVCPSEDFLKTLLHVEFPNINTLMLSRDVLENVGLFNETRCYPEDWDLCLRTSLAGYRFGHIDDELVGVIIREGSFVTLEIQHILKKNLLDVLERVFSNLTPQQRICYGEKRLLRKTKLKLAMAYLANGQKRNFARTFVGACAYPLRPVAYVGAGLVCLLPAWFLREMVARLWRLNSLRKRMMLKK